VELKGLVDAAPVFASHIGNVLSVCSALLPKEAFRVVAEDVELKYT
jgi:hypothetical protein